MTYLLGIDLGTTNTKALLFDEAGRVCAAASEPTPTVRQGPGRAVHMAEDLWQVTARQIRAALAQLEGRPEVAGVAVASMGEEGFPLDAAGRVIYPGILWYDERTQEQVPWWQERVGAERVYRITGLPIRHTFTALKLQWLSRHEPEIMRRAAHWLWVSDYIAFRLTGSMATSPSLAARSMLYDLASGTWSEELLAAANLPEHVLPPVLPSGTVLGRVTEEAAKTTGLATGTPVAAGGHDHICGKLAAGAVEAGDVLHSGGTAESLSRVLSRAELEQRLAEPGDLTCGAHVVPDRWYVAGGRHTGAIVAWWQQLLSGHGPLEEQARAVPPGANGLVFVPYMFGKGQPDPDPLASGALLGMTADHGPAEVMRAVVEGVCYDTVALQRALSPDGRYPVTVIGGLAHNRLWLQLKANILNVELRLPVEREAVAQGAALLAGLGAGLYRNVDEVVQQAVRYAETIEPEPRLVEEYERLYESRYLPAAGLAREVVRGTLTPNLIAMPSTDGVGLGHGNSPTRGRGEPGQTR